MFFDIFLGLFKVEWQTTQIEILECLISYFISSNSLSNPTETLSSDIFNFFQIYPNISCSAKLNCVRTF